MRRHAEDEGVFIRSVASSGHIGGLSESIHRIIEVMDFAGYDLVVVETVGAGQSEIAGADIADICVVINAPNLGDDIQAMKAGIIEIADVLVVNKADLPQAQRTTQYLQNMLKSRGQRGDIPIIETVATNDAGVAELDAVITGLLATSARNKKRNRERRMHRLIAERAGRFVYDLIRGADGAEMQALIKAAAAGNIDLTEAMRRALRIVG